MYWYSRHLCSITWVVHLPKYVCLPHSVCCYSEHFCSITRGSIGQSRFLCQFWCTGIQGISGLLPGGLHLTWLYNVNWLFTTLIIQKSEEIPTFPEESKWLPNTSHNIYLMMHLGGRSARISAKISFNNNITYYNWQIWALIVEICICHLGGVSGVFQGCWGGLHMTWLCNANWLMMHLMGRSANCHSWSWDVSSNVILPFLMARHQ